MTTGSAAPTPNRQRSARPCRSGRGARRAAFGSGVQPAEEHWSKRRCRARGDRRGQRACFVKDLSRALLRGADIDVVGCCETAHDLAVEGAELLGRTLRSSIFACRPHTRDEGLQSGARNPCYPDPAVGVLVLSQYLELGLALKLFADSTDGAGYLLKDRISDVDEFVGAVRRISEGGSAIDPVIVSTLVLKASAGRPTCRVDTARAGRARAHGGGAFESGHRRQVGNHACARSRNTCPPFSASSALPSGGSDSRRVLAVLLYLRS